MQENVYYTFVQFVATVITVQHATTRAMQYNC